MRNACVHLCSMVLLCSIFSSGQSVIPKEPKVSLLAALDSLGAKHCKFFTIEQSRSAGVGSFDEAKLPISIVDMPLKQAQRRIQKIFPTIEFQVSPEQENVIHVVDTRLALAKNYPLRETLAHFSFEGTPMGLVQALQKRNINVMYSPAAFSGGVIRIEAVTKLKVSAESRSVRDILTDFIPLKGYRPVIWTASAVVDDKTGTFRSEIIYSGPKSTSTTMNEDSCDAQEHLPATTN